MLYECGICGEPTATTAAQYRAQELRSKQRITRRCPGCETEISVKLELADREFPCPVCEQTISGLSERGSATNDSSVDVPVANDSDEDRSATKQSTSQGSTDAPSVPSAPASGQEIPREIPAAPSVKSSESDDFVVDSSLTIAADADVSDESDFDLDEMLKVAAKVQHENQAGALFSSRHSRDEHSRDSRADAPVQKSSGTNDEVNDARLLAKCGSCNQNLLLKPKFAGRKIECPNCQHQLRVPGKKVPQTPHDAVATPPLASEVTPDSIAAPVEGQSTLITPPPVAANEDWSSPRPSPAAASRSNDTPANPGSGLPSSGDMASSQSATRSQPIAQHTQPPVAAEAYPPQHFATPPHGSPQYPATPHPTIPNGAGQHPQAPFDPGMGAASPYPPVPYPPAPFPPQNMMESWEFAMQQRLPPVEPGSPPAPSETNLSTQETPKPIVDSPRELEVSDSQSEIDRQQARNAESETTGDAKVESAYLHAVCGECGKKIRARVRMAGRRIQCPDCRKPVQIPGGDAVEPKTRRTLPKEMNLVPGKSSHELSLAIESACSREPSAASGDSSNLKPLTATLGRFALRRIEKVLADYVSVAATGGSVSGGEAAIRELLDSRDVRTVSLLEPAFPHLSRSLKLQVLKDLPQLGDPGAFALVAHQLKSDDETVVRAALVTLGQLNDRRAVSPLLSYVLANPGDRVRGLDALQKLEGATPALLQVLEESQSDSLTHLVIEGLGRRKDPKAVAAMERFLQHPSAAMRAHVAEMLAGFGEGRSTGVLLPSLRDPSPAVRLHAANAIFNCPDPRYFEPLSRVLGDESRDVKLVLLAALGACGDRRAIQILRPYLHSDDSDVVMTVTEALGRLGDRESATFAIALLEEVGDDPSQQPKTLILIDTLRRMGDDRAVLPLINLIGHPSYKVRTRVAEALGKLKDSSAAQDLEELLYRDPMEETKVAAAKSLGEICDAGSVRALIEYGLRDTPAVRTQSVIALGALITNPEAREAIRGALNDIAPPVRYQAIAQLSEHGDKQSVPLIEVRLGDSEEMIQRAAMAALRKLGDSRTDQELQKLMSAGGKKGGASNSKPELGRTTLAPKRNFRMSDLVPSSLAGIVHLPRISFASWNMESLRSMDSLDKVPGGQKTLVGASLALIFVGYFLWSWAFGPKSYAGVPLRGSVAVLASNLNGDLIVAGRTTEMIEVWNSTGPTQVDFLEHVPCRWLGFSSDGTHLLAVGGNQVSFVSISSAGSLGEVKPLEGGTQPIIHCGFSADRNYAITCDQTGSVVRWNLQTGASDGKHSIPEADSITSLAVSPDGSRYVIATSRDKHIDERSASSGEVLTTYPGGKYPFTTLAYHPDGEQFACGQSTMNGTIVFFSSGSKSPSRVLKGGTTSVGGLRFLDNGTLVVIRQAKVELWGETAESAEKEVAVALERIDAFTLAGATGTDISVACNEASPIYIYDTATSQFKSQADVIR